MHETFQITPDLQGKTIAAVLKQRLPDKSWSKVRQLIDKRRVSIGGEVCRDPARRVQEGEEIQLHGSSVPQPAEHEKIVLRYVDDHIVVAEKPSGISTVRHPAERDWPEKRRRLTPTLDDLVFKQLQDNRKQTSKIKKRQRLRVVHRLDKETSGLVVFARTVVAERNLGKQFHKHTVHRKYLAVIPGFLPAQSITSYLIRDRGDGRRGSTKIAGQGRKAVTHLAGERRWENYTLLSCRLETGRTHQIRIHLSEAGHPVCGERVYNRKPNGEVILDESGAPRLALHATELGFNHPVAGDPMTWTMPLPKDLAEFVNSLR